MLPSTCRIVTHLRPTTHACHLCEYLPALLALSEALFDFSSLADLHTWLTQLDESANPSSPATTQQV
ncbi:MAG: DUF4351 domain-containing protein [Candidatus Viridilinea halotolerans]|uniref:DUF4351 domain-containing protein n=1 Tax=Candidatus Viridilinea halotolerans TaxID=2491704 RepID=A0A426U3E7_9CHLR|nr:MAG: DUF4351 domain-containing protein [Candidatus Viridilinea halotolerans]